MNRSETSPSARSPKSASLVRVSAAGALPSRPTLQSSAARVRVSSSNRRCGTPRLRARRSLLPSRPTRARLRRPARDRAPSRPRTSATKTSDFESGRPAKVLDPEVERLGEPPDLPGRPLVEHQAETVRLEARPLLRPERDPLPVGRVLRRAVECGVRGRHVSRRGAAGEGSEPEVGVRRERLVLVGVRGVDELLAVRRNVPVRRLRPRRTAARRGRPASGPPSGRRRPSRAPSRGACAFRPSSCPTAGREAGRRCEPWSSSPPAP